MKNEFEVGDVLCQFHGGRCSFFVIYGIIKTPHATTPDSWLYEMCIFFSDQAYEKNVFKLSAKTCENLCRDVFGIQTRRIKKANK